VIGGENMDNDIVKADVLQNISSKIAEYLDIKDSIIEDDFVEVLGDSFKVIGVLRKASMAISKKKFISFLKGFSNSEIPTEQQLKRLSDYINSEQKAEFISDTFSKILLSRSTKACLIMGSILQRIVDNKKNLTYSELICINSLTVFFDEDVELYKYIYKQILNSKKHYIRLSMKFYNSCKEDGIDIDNFSLMLEKCLANQLLMREYDVDLNIDEDTLWSSSVENDEYIRVSKPGILLFKYINELNI
jgi:hypothetical protein